MSRICVGLLAAASVLAPADAACAQSKQQSQDPAVVSGDKPAPEHALGDWGGARTKLEAKGVDFTVSYESETAADVAGGLKRGVDYAHSIDLKADIDFGKLAGLNGFSVHGALVERAGRNASADFMHDHLNQAQQIYGSGGDVAAHLADLYAEQKFAGEAFDLEAGRLDVGADFAASPLYCEFMSLSDCPSPRDLGAATGFTTYPSSTWGGRLKARSGDFALQFGAYQVRPIFGGRSGFNWGADQTTGVYAPLELDWTPKFGSARLIGHYKLGVAYDSSTYPDLYRSVTGAPIGLGNRPGRPDRGRWDAYVLADQMLARTGPNGTDGVIVLGGYSRADPRVSVLSEFGFAGVLASGVVPGRPHNSIGAQVAVLRVSPDLVATQALEAADGEPLLSGLTSFPLVDGVQGREVVLEGRYDIRLMEGLHLMPDVQYIIHPAATARVPDATVIGLRVDLQL